MDNTDPALLFELLCMADLYAHKCTKQLEKFAYYADKVPWRWEECEAAFLLLKERGDYFALRRAWLDLQRAETTA